MKAIILDIKGIKCDNPACGWHDDNAVFDPVKWLNHPCLSCGANLFTEADYKTHKKIVRNIGIINFLFSPFMRGPAKYATIPLEMNGTGKVEVGPVTGIVEIKE